MNLNKVEKYEFNSLKIITKYGTIVDCMHYDILHVVLIDDIINVTADYGLLNFNFPVKNCEFEYEFEHELTAITCIDQNTKIVIY